jgi:hypothetical protein
MWYLKNNTSGVILTYLVVSIKNARFNCQPSTPMQSYVSISTPFMEIDDKGEEIVQRYESFGRDWTKKLKLDMDNGQRGSNIEEKRWIKILEQEKHTNRESKLMNFD